MKKLSVVAAIIIASQFLIGCIAFLPPYHKTSTETVIIIERPEPIIVEPPVVIIRPPVEQPSKPIKERPKQVGIDDEKRDGDSGRDKSESLRNSGERKRR